MRSFVLPTVYTWPKLIIKNIDSSSPSLLLNPILVNEQKEFAKSGIALMLVAVPQCVANSANFLLTATGNAVFLLGP